jgi:hypothetical protein
MKKPLRLGFTDTNEQIASFFATVLNTQYEVTIDNANPDYLIFGDRNFGENNLNYSPGKTVKIFYTGENQRPWDYQAHYALSFEHVENEKMYRLPLYVIYDWHNRMKKEMSWATHIRDESDLDADKKQKFCSFVVRNPGCVRRNEFFHKLSARKHVDSGGPLFNNIGRVLDYGDAAPKAKNEWLKDYKFNICFENSTYPGYTTEKLYEAYIGGTIPIYWGSATIEVDFNPKAFLNWYDYGSDEALIDAVLELDSNPHKYRDMYMQPLFTNGVNRFMKLDRFVEWFDKNVYKEKL